MYIASLVCTFACTINKLKKTFCGRVKKDGRSSDPKQRINSGWPDPQSFV